MDVAKAVMVTAELDFGPKIPSIAEALNQVERRYQPDDGQGRTFAILDAYGEPTPDGKLHISMHVSSEKPGGGQLVFKKTGEVLWRGSFTQTQEPLAWNLLNWWQFWENGPRWMTVEELAHIGVKRLLDELGGSIQWE